MQASRTITTPTYTIRYKNQWGAASRIHTDFRAIFIKTLECIRDMEFKVISIKFKVQEGRYHN